MSQPWNASMCLRRGCGLGLAVAFFSVVSVVDLATPGFMEPRTFVALAQDANTMADRLRKEAEALVAQADAEGNPDAALPAYREAQAKLQSIIERYPSSQAAARLVLGDPLMRRVEAAITEADAAEEQCILKPTRECLSRLVVSAIELAEREQAKAEKPNMPAFSLNRIAIAMLEAGNKKAAWRAAKIYSEGTQTGHSVFGKLAETFAAAGDEESAIHLANQLEPPNLRVDTLVGIAAILADPRDLTRAKQILSVIDDDEERRLAFDRVLAAAAQAALRDGEFEHSLLFVDQTLDPRRRASGLLLIANALFKVVRNREAHALAIRLYELYERESLEYIIFDLATLLADVDADELASSLLTKIDNAAEKAVLLRKTGRTEASTAARSRALSATTNGDISFYEAAITLAGKDDFECSIEVLDKLRFDRHGYYTQVIAAIASCQARKGEIHMAHHTIDKVEDLEGPYQDFAGLQRVKADVNQQVVSELIEANKLTVAQDFLNSSELGEMPLSGLTELAHQQAKNGDHAAARDNLRRARDLIKIREEVGQGRWSLYDEASKIASLYTELGDTQDALVFARSWGDAYLDKALILANIAARLPKPKDD